MAVKGGPKILTDGLVFHLDAAGAISDKVYNPNGLLVEYLVVGGGGGGSGWGDGVGGGAGGFLESATRLSGNTYSVVVGAGGNRGINNSSSRGSNGGDSQLGDNIIAYGGGGAGAKSVQDGLNGGSGGGGYGNNAVPHGIGGSGIIGQGNDGGDGTSVYRGGSGGGAGEQGRDGTFTSSNFSRVPGGIGKVSKKDFNWQYYAGGGGTGGGTNNGDSSGGLGGGGTGGGTNQDGTSGQANTGGGGGGGGTWSTRSTFGGNGGSGIVIIRYKGKQKATGGDTIVYKNGYTIHTFTSSGSFVLNESVDGLSTNKIVGTLVNMDSSNYNSGNRGYFSFDGSNEHIDFGSISLTGNITVVAWIKILGGQGTYRHIIDSSDNSWHLAISSSNYPYLWNGTNWTNSGISLSSNVWYMITGTYDQSNLYYYVNDTLSDSLASNASLSTNNVNIGRWQSGNTRYFNGNIGIVTIYSTALSLDEISDFYNATKGRYGL